MYRSVRRLWDNANNTAYVKICFEKSIFCSSRKSYNVLFFPLIIFKSPKHCLHCSKCVTQKAEFLWTRCMYMFLFSYILLIFFSLTWMQYRFYLLSLFLRVLLSKLSSLLLRSLLFLSLLFLSSCYLFPSSVFPSCTSSNFVFDFGLQCFA